uniref:Uncharacterized protein n=1 Tax=Coniferiporia sulphurascens TaxID=175648 RepID=A0A5B9R9T1_CONSH|nr:hypothetical protein PSUO_000066 [Coniferiporia sulphurascens]QEG57198.1 hypothetical protein PSUO_000066 [Coniferiporia sulphurascens]
MTHDLNSFYISLNLTLFTEDTQPITHLLLCMTAFYHLSTHLADTFPSKWYSKKVECMIVDINHGKGEKVSIEFKYNFKNKTREQFIRYATKQVVLNTPGVNSLHVGIHNTYYYHKLTVAYFYAPKW